ncbi:hypothetical protein Anas_06968 [Armadillidium nasatum]|uniref:Uncharacterized protein n=1 Tax=Armadillidium nasatum TaxID=96803 RepID=A0A5N5T6J0_9CRUS|nr:hypothetical protein Anas_06968 [Armadillidium nasatum]
MKMDEIMRESTFDSKDSESNVLETVNFESELLNCVKEVVENISKNEKEDEDSNERHFLNSMDDENNLPIQIKENTSSDISALFEMATKNSSTEFQPFNPFCGFTSIREPCEGVVISASEPKIKFDRQNSFKTAETSRKPRKKIRRKKWCVKRCSKKNEVAAEHSQLSQNKNCGNGYARLYESCLNFCHHFNEEVPSLSLASSDGEPLPENELIVLMAKDLISKNRTRQCKISQ